MSSFSLRVSSRRRPAGIDGLRAIFALAFLALAPAVARAQIGITGSLSLVETGGAFASGNLARSGTAFAQDEIGVAPHAVAKVNDGAFGNASSWIGAGPNSFVGISLGSTPVVIHRVAFGRDNTSALTDRTTGLYTLQYTAVPRPSASTPESDWVTLGTLDYPPADPGTFPAPWLRRVFQFPQVVATGFRIKVTSAGSAIAIDEMELYSPPNGLVVTGRGLALVSEGGTQRSAHNLALASAGATPFAKDSLATPPHALANLNDGVFGNPSSWIAGSADTFVGVSLGTTPVPVARVAFGRDNTGALTDRALGTYTLQYTSVPNPGAATPDSAWITLGTLDYQQPGGLNFAQPARRHEFAFPAVEATGLRLRVVTSGGLLAQVGIDEFEVYGPPRLRVAQPGGITRTLANRVALWGDNSFGQLNMPDDLTSPRFLDVGRFHVATLDATGAYRGWSTYQTALAADPAARTGLKAVAAGTSHNLVIQSDGTAAVWGSAIYGAPASPPPPALAGVTVRAVAAGYFFSVARTATGEVVAWAEDSSGQASVPAGLAGVRAIEAGENHVVALKNDGTVVAWGNNTYGQRNVPAGLANVRAVAADFGYALALKEDGTVVAWGLNDKGQTNVPAGLAHVKAIAAGDGHSAALLEDDSLVLWGYNASGQLTLPAALAERAFIRSISLGGFVSGALYAAPAPYLFGQAPSGGQLTRTFTVSNDGGSPLALDAPALVGGASARFSLDTSALPSSLAPGQSATFAVTFSPSDTAAAATRLVIKSDDPETPAFVFAVSANLADTAAPVITPPANIALTAATGAGTATSFSYRVADDFDPAPAVVVSHPSGGVFPIGVTPVTITATDASGNISTATFTVTVSPPPITLVETGGSFARDNLARTGAAFALNEIGIAPHTIGAVNDGVYGNANSWIAGTLNSFVGIGFGATPVPVRAIAFGRDNTGGQTTRAAGTYTLQFTTTPNPGATTPDSAWVTLGSITLPGTFPSPERRHLFSFLPVEATGIRLRVQSADFGVGIDEIELYTAVPAPSLSVEQPAGTALVAGSTTFDFGTHEAGATVPARIVTLRNTGDRVLSITQIVHFGEAVNSYALTTAATSLNLASGAATSFGVSFAATGLGARAATLRIVTNDPVTPVFDIALAGEVLDTAAPVIAAYADVVADATSTAGAVVNFPSPTITDASGLPVTVVFSPAGGGLFPIGTTPVTLTATDAAGNSSTRSFNVQVIGRARAVFELAGAQPIPGTPPTLPFGETNLGSVVTRSLVLRNTGLVPLTVTGASFTGAQASDFSVGLAGPPFTLGVEETRVLDLNFNPAASGARSATLVLATTDPAPVSYTLLLAGSGIDEIAPVITPPANITASTSSASGLRVLFPPATVTDNGADPVTVAYSAASGSLFLLGSTPVTVTATDTAGNVSTTSFMVEIVAGFYPPEVPVGGTVPANLALGRPSFARDEAGSPHLAAKVNDRTYGNPSSWIGAGLDSFVGVNLGSTPVAINRVAFSRDHATAFNDRVTAEYIVQYTTSPSPGAATPDSAWLPLGAVTYPGAFANPHRRILYGFAEVQATGLRIVTRSVGLPAAIDEIEIHGPAGALSVSDSNATPLVSGGATFDFGSRALGTTGTARVFTLGNPGAYPLSVNTAMTGAHANDFIVTPSAGPSSSIPPGGSATLEVAFRPTAPGPRQAVLRIESAAGPLPFEIAFTGAGVDSAPPQITPPANRVVVVADLALTGAVVAYPAAIVTDDSSVPPTVTYSHPSGDFFPRGLTTVTITATDASGKSSTATFNVSVLARSPLGIEDSAGNTLSVGRVIRQWGGSTPAAPANLNNVVDVVLNFRWGMALLDDGTVTAWGDSIAVSQLPAGLNSVVAISGEPTHGLALKADGTVVAWGSFDNIISAYVPPGLDNVVSIATSPLSAYAVKADGTTVAWGIQNAPLSTISADASPAILVDAGIYGVITVKPDGTTWNKTNFNLSEPNFSGVKQASVGADHMLALTNGGTVVARGNNTFGQYAGVSGATGIVEISAGYNTSLARRADGTILGAGANFFGVFTAAQALEDVVRLGKSKADSAAVVVKSWPELAVGSAVHGASASRTLTVRNHGLTPLHITGLAITGPDSTSFSVNGAGLASPIPPGGTATVPITFTPPTGLGRQRATLRIDSDDPTEPYLKLRLTGTVADVTPPVFGALANMVVQTRFPNGRTVTFAPTATDLSGAAPTISTVPASGSLFPLGVTTVQVTATDASGNTTTGSFTVTVVLDQTPPLVTAPADLTAYASNSAGVSVLFAPAATDNTGLPPLVATTPASGARFPLGETIVTATATDSAGNVSPGVTFKVTVLPATDLPDVPSGGAVPANFATGKTSFAQDEIGIAPHTISKLNDGAYGNANSWIAGNLASFAGINLGATPVLLDRIAFGRDHTGVQTTRAEGVYTVQYTTVPNPGATTPDSAWLTLGAVQNPGTLASPARRNLFAFAPVAATGVRIRASAPVFAVGIDEIELYAPVNAPKPSELWRNLHFGVIDNAGPAADLADPDGDGVVNLLEYAFGLDPKSAAQRATPAAQLVGGYLEIRFIPPAGVTDIVYGAQSSTTLAADSWQTVPDTGTAPERRFRMLISEQPRVFLRLVVTRPAP